MITDEELHEEVRAELRAKYCWGEMVLVDDCYGMTGGRKYVCRECQSYVVVLSPDNHPAHCMVPRP